MEEDNNDLEKESVREDHKTKFGERYMDGKLIKVGDYFFFMDTKFNGIDFKYYEKELGAAVGVFSRYGVKQEDVMGVELWGSVPVVLLSKGKSADEEGNESLRISKILVFHEGDRYYLKGDGDVESFGIKSIDDVGQSRILMLEKEEIIRNTTEPEEVLIDQIVNRNERWLQRDKIRKFFDEYCGDVMKLVSSPKTVSNEDVKKSVFELMVKMDFVKIENMQGQGGGSGEWSLEDVRHFSNLSNKTVLGVVDYIGAVDNDNDNNKNQEKGVSRVREVRPAWSAIEEMITNGEKIFVPENESLAVIPALYILIQWMSEFYSDNEEMRRSDLKEYWGQIEVLRNSDKVEGRLNVVMGLSTEWSNKGNADTKKVKQILKKTNDVVLIDLIMDEVKTRTDNEWKVVERPRGE